MPLYGSLPISHVIPILPSPLVCVYGLHVRHKIAARQIVIYTGGHRHTISKQEYIRPGLLARCGGKVLVIACPRRTGFEDKTWARSVEGPGLREVTMKDARDVRLRLGWTLQQTTGLSLPCHLELEGILNLTPVDELLV